jgi:diguanylate cyclase
MDVPVPRRRLAVVVCAALVLVFALVLRLRPFNEFVTLAFDDLGEGIAAGIAAVPCFWRARHFTGRWRLSWILVGLGLASWSIGEFIWSYYELISSQETPFPSLADAGFLGFPVFALAGLLVRPSAAFVGRARARMLLDGVMVVASLLIISWTTSLGTVYHAGAQNTFGLVVSLAYPGSDVVLITVAVLVASRSRLNAGTLLLVGGLVSMAVADSAFAYLVAAGTYGTGAFTDVAWVAAFLAIGASALFPNADEGSSAGRVEGGISLALPYLVLFAGTAATVVTVVQNTDNSATITIEAVAIVGLLLRQWLVMLDNRRLTLDVMAQKDELTFRAFHDPLTGLANRALFYDRVAHALELHQRDLRPVSVIFVDLDDFKSVNDAFGHDAGDLVLSAVAERLRAVVRTGDTIARLGGDEFAVLLEDDDDPELVAVRLLDAFAAPVRVGTRDVPVRASIGSTMLHAAEQSMDSQELLKQADLAMYAAKRGGKGTAVSYTAELRAGSDADDDLELRIALSEDVRIGRIGTTFEPIVYAESGELCAMEALARWEYRGAPVPPAHFIPLAERGGFLADLDLVVARRALQIATSPECVAHGMIVSTNIGLARMAECDLPRRLAELVAEFGAVPNRLVVEVSEQELLDDPRTTATLAALRGLGVGLAIDDFGVGYSNLSRLERIQPDVVKLDRSFVAPLDDPGAPRKLLRRVIQLAHDLGAVVVGEGVETHRQRDALAELGCDAVQGFLFSMAEEEAAEVA